eukprot:9426341-Pyramimonas_sp.AAC.3
MLPPTPHPTLTHSVNLCTYRPPLLVPLRHYALDSSASQGGWLLPVTRFSSPSWLGSTNGKRVTGSNQPPREAEFGAQWRSGTSIGGL